MKRGAESVGDGDYVPKDFSRGDVLDGERTGAGLTDKHATHSLRLPIRGVQDVADGTHAIPYSWLVGATFLSDDKSCIVFTFAGELWSGRGWTEGRWTVVAKGSKNMEKLFNYIAEARRKGLSLGGGGKDDDWQVDKITVTAEE